MIDTKKYIGIPFKTRSFDKKEGLDCLTFILYFLEQEFNYKFDITNVPEYDDDWYMNPNLKGLYVKNLEKYCTLTEYDNLSKIKEFDLLLFSYFGDKSAITHVGIYIGNNKFIHSVKGVGSCVTNLDVYKKALKWIGVVK